MYFFYSHLLGFYVKWKKKIDNLRTRMDQNRNFDQHTTIFTAETANEKKYNNNESRGKVFAAAKRASFSHEEKI